MLFLRFIIVYDRSTVNERKGVEWYYMKTCPNCGFEPLNGDLICPNCKAEIKENIAKKISEDQVDHPETSEAVENDNIEWAQLKEISLGEVMDQFHHLYDETSVEEPTEVSKTVDRPERDLAETSVTEFEDDPILAAYLKAYKEGRHLEAQEEIKALIRQKETEQASQETDHTEKQTDPLPNDDAFVQPESEPSEDEEKDTIANISETKELIETKEPTETEEIAETEETEETEEIKTANTKEAKEIAEHVDLEAKSLPIVANEVIDQDMILETSEALIDEVTSSTPTSEAEQKVQKAVDLLNQETTTKVIPEAASESFIPATDTLATNHEQNQSPKEEPKEEQPLKTKRVKRSRKKWSKKQKRIVWYTVAVIAIISVSGGVYYAHQQELERQAQAALVKKEQTVATISQEIKALSTLKTEPIIKSTTTQQQLLDYQKQLTDYKGIKDEKATNQFLTTLLTQYEQETTLNEQFDSPVLVDGQVNEKAYVVDTQTFLAVPLNGDTTFEKAYNQAVAIGQKQVEQAQTVKEAVAKLTSGLKGEELATSVTNTTYADTLKQVNALKDTALKTKLTNELKPVKTALDKREAAAKAAKAQAEKEKVAQAAAAEQQASEDAMLAKIAANTQYSQASQVLSASTPVNKENRPIIASRQSDIDNSTSEAWQWADGVYDSVINRCIARGYIVSGGFYLQRARIENGQGYYNLYATTNESRLLSGVGESGIPMYIATINDKTGFFKGNGNGTN